MTSYSRTSERDKIQLHEMLNIKINEFLIKNDALFIEEMVIEAIDFNINPATELYYGDAGNIYNELEGIVKRAIEFANSNEDTFSIKDNFISERFEKSIARYFPDLCCK